MKVNYEGVKFLISQSSSIERMLAKVRIKKAIGRFIGKPYEKDPFLVAAERILKESSCPLVIDVGANIGIMTLPLAKQFPHAKFYAIEPHPLPASRFIQNCLQNELSNVFLLNAAIGPSQEVMKIYICPTNSGGHRVTGFEGRNDFEKMTTLDHISVPSLSLKSLFKHFGITSCDILKVDVEGFECQVLESLEDLLNPQTVVTLIVEYGPEGMKQAGKTGWNLVKMLLERGYKCHELKTNKPIKSETDIPLLDRFSVTDFLFS